MKKKKLANRGIVFIGIVAFLFSCDKIENIYPETYSTDLNTALYPGEWQDYVDNEWPDFTTITASTDRNVMVEDFTGHNCTYCPAAAVKVHEAQQINPNRVFPVGIHISPQGVSGFQAVTAQYPVNFVNQNGIDLGVFFGQGENQTWSGFTANPKVGANRSKGGSGNTTFFSQSYLISKVNEQLSSGLKVAIKSKLNYYEQTKGAFLHTEIEVLDANLTSDLGTIVYLIEDSLVAPQLDGGTYVPDYVHRDIYRKNITNLTWGRSLTSDMLVEGKYRFDYSFEVPNQLAPEGQTGDYNAENMHVLIFVYDKVTYEVYQVVKEKFE